MTNDNVSRTNEEIGLHTVWKHFSFEQKTHIHILLLILYVEQKPQLEAIVSRDKLSKQYL